MCICLSPCGRDHRRIERSSQLYPYQACTIIRHHAPQPPVGYRRVSAKISMTRKGWLLFVAMGVIWGLPYLLIKVAVGELTPATLVFFRTAILMSRRSEEHTSELQSLLD